MMQKHLWGCQTCGYFGIVLSMKKPGIPMTLVRKALNGAIARLERMYRSMESGQQYDLGYRAD